MKSLLKLVSGPILSLLLVLPLTACDSQSSAKQELPVNNKLGGDFQLDSTEGGKGKLSDFAGKVVLLNFGYTHCPDICPMVLNRMANVMNALGDSRSKVQPVFITFDPVRDTVERLKQYLPYFGKEFVGFTGTPEQIAEVNKLYGVIAIEQKSESAAGILFSHSDYIYLLDDAGRIRALYGTDEPIDKIVEGIESLL
ncbi:SCO family protein [Ketobacter sp. MCCC 1A13808]|uniref:SCO family protein n=1 Tax=Ketobacter sp. MCCC 1A13808 TaxID=2602738 RepID=UPI000F229C4E|nr:SCO family protein [Ketobacter sp. MCCC 1A13808]MVF12972.1 SCO family protein [Ketobacter sp. MCCC 1A13808]RLP53819.1 MAG: SCO family protein [Ketobacter sp.]